MRQSKIFQKTFKDVSKEDVSRNAQLLSRSGYIHQLMAGVYSYLPFGLKVLNNIENIIRQEMEAIGAQEILMPALQPRENWDKTARWDKMDVLYKLKGSGDRDLALGATHEEVMTPLAAAMINSYKDFPGIVYQIQTKFRNEARAKSGLLRGREFRMKDMYSFHRDQESFDRFYEQAIQAYMKVYKRCGLGDITKLTYASGGDFSKYSHEFQTITEYGEDVIYLIPETNEAINKEIIDDEDALRGIIKNYKKGDEKDFEQVKAIEVGNTFSLGTFFCDAFDFKYADQDGTRKLPLMGCYGIGSSRVMGTIAECLSDDNGLIWSEEVAPFQVHLISLVQDPDDVMFCENLYQELTAKGVSVLYDDRPKVRAGTKFADSDLLGMPRRIVVGKKTLSQNMVEVKKRNEADSQQVAMDNISLMLSV